MDKNFESLAFEAINMLLAYTGGEFLYHPNYGLIPVGRRPADCDEMEFEQESIFFSDDMDEYDFIDMLKDNPPR